MTAKTTKQWSQKIQWRQQKWNKSTKALYAYIWQNDERKKGEMNGLWNARLKTLFIFSLPKRRRERESKILTIAKCWHGWGLTMIAASRNSEFRIRIVTIVGICWCHSDYFISSTFSHKTIKRKLISPVFFNYLASHSLCLKLFQWSTLYEYWIATEYFFPYRMYKKRSFTDITLPTARDSTSNSRHLTLFGLAFASAYSLQHNQQSTRKSHKNIVTHKWSFLLSLSHFLFVLSSPYLY